MAGMVPIGRVLVLAAGVADARRDHPVALTKQLLHSPETAAGEDRGLGVIRHVVHSLSGLAEGEDVRAYARAVEPDLEGARRSLMRSVRHAAAKTTLPGGRRSRLRANASRADASGKTSTGGGRSSPASASLAIDVSWS